MNMEGSGQGSGVPTVDVPLETPVEAYTKKNIPGLNLQPLKEPRGFIRVLQFVFSIFAFSTTAGFWTNVLFYISCDKDKEEIIISYPFRLNLISKAYCEDVVVQLVGDFSPQAQYFVATGVLSFLFCVAITFVYIFYDNMYQNNALAPFADFIITVIFAVFWLTASSAWAQGVSDLKYFSNPEIFLQNIPNCSSSTNLCKSDYSGSFATLNVSLIFGFLNFLLWAASLWFVFKETEWFKRRQQNPTG